MALRAKGRVRSFRCASASRSSRTSRYVDQVHAEMVPDKLEIWEGSRFDVIFKGDDWRGTEKGDKLERDFAGVGVEVVYFPYTVETSSTQLRNALDVLLAAGLMSGLLDAVLCAASDELPPGCPAV